MIMLIFFVYIPVLVLSDKFLGSLYPGSLIIVLPSFLYLLVKRKIESLFGFDETVLKVIGVLFSAIFYIFLPLLFAFFLLALAWTFWDIVFS